MIDLTNPVFADENKARKQLEKLRWPNGPACPHCGVADEWTPLKGKAHRPGLYQCNACRQQFSVTVGTVFERSKVPLNKWLAAIYMMCASKKGVSAHQIHRTLGVTYKTAWFMAHRIREAMRELHPDGQLGEGGGMVEADETYVGGKKKGDKGGSKKEKVLSLVERGGRIRSYHVPRVNAHTLKPILRQQISPDAHLRTDEAKHYGQIGKHFASHETVNHSLDEYVRGDAYTNTLENYFSILKRGLNGVYQHCSAKHLKRYVGEFDFRYNYRVKLGFSDEDRVRLTVRGADGKRLTYGGPA